MNISSRNVRVFLSSTFKDFTEERDLLVKKVFPELRRRCRERQVELIDVDLRWGITEEQAQHGEVLPICLAEIDRARPYFMSFIGERYGWVPERQHYDPGIMQEQPWLLEHAGGKSVTELEVLHGVLNNPAMAGRAFFYLRDPAYAQAKGGPYLCESEEHQHKLENLKTRIRQSNFPIVENYHNPKDLAELVQKNLWKIIDEEFPISSVPDALTLERSRHESYGAVRLGLYLGGEEYFRKIDAALENENAVPVLITGASGAGKSALMANWISAYGQAHPDVWFFMHYVGSTNDAAELLELVARWIREMASKLGEESDVTLPADEQTLYYVELPAWLDKANTHAKNHGCRWIFVLDGLDKLKRGQDLRWLPENLPSNMRLLCSCLEGEALGAARTRQWTELNVKPLTDYDRRELIRKYLGKYRKSLTLERETKLLSHVLSENPLFLRTLLEELRIFGAHEELDRKLDGLLQSRTIDHLFNLVLERVEGDTNAQDVRLAMQALWASRSGLSQEELLGITALVPATWAPIQLALDEVLLNSGGRIIFAHDYLRKAVENRYLIDEQRKKSAHKCIAEWFAERPLDFRGAEELPWQYQIIGDLGAIADFMAQYGAIELMFSAERQSNAVWGFISPLLIKDKLEPKELQDLEDIYAQMAKNVIKLVGEGESCDWGFLRLKLLTETFLANSLYGKQEAIEAAIKGFSIGFPLMAKLLGSGYADTGMVSLSYADEIADNARVLYWTGLIKDQANLQWLLSLCNVHPILKWERDIDKLQKEVLEEIRLEPRNRKHFLDDPDFSQIHEYIRNLQL